jgi:hypothetical protein
MGLLRAMVLAIFLFTHYRAATKKLPLSIIVESAGKKVNAPTILGVIDVIVTMPETTWE